MEWISVKDMLPRFKSKYQHDYYLVYGENYGVFVRPYDGLHECWNDEEDDDIDSYESRITHWMPLPKSPKN